MSAFVDIKRAGEFEAIGSERAGARAVPLWIAVAIVVLYAIAGLTGHDPWKQDEAYVFGGILDLLKSGDWVVVKVGGVPFMEKPPLFHWVGALTATPVYVHEGAFDWIRSVVLDPKLSSAHTPANRPLMIARMSETIPCSVSPYPMA